jgi:hypothetical protein
MNQVTIISDIIVVLFRLWPYVIEAEVGFPALMHKDAFQFYSLLEAVGIFWDRKLSVNFVNYLNKFHAGKTLSEFIDEDIIKIAKDYKVWAVMDQLKLFEDAAYDVHMNHFKKIL